MQDSMGMGMVCGWGCALWWWGGDGSQVCGDGKNFMGMGRKWGWFHYRVTLYSEVMIIWRFTNYNYSYIIITITTTIIIINPISSIWHYELRCAEEKLLFEPDSTIHQTIGVTDYWVSNGIKQSNDYHVYITFFTAIKTVQQINLIICAVNVLQGMTNKISYQWLSTRIAPTCSCLLIRSLFSAAVTRSSSGRAANSSTSSSWAEHIRTTDNTGLPGNGNLRSLLLIKPLNKQVFRGPATFTFDLLTLKWLQGWHMSPTRSSWR